MSGTDGGWLLPSVTDPERVCIQLQVPNDPAHLAAFWGALWELTYWNNWQRDNDKRGTEVAAVWKDVWFKARYANDGLLGCASGDCLEFGPSAAFIEYLPMNPYSEPGEVPDGYNIAPWYVATLASNVLLGTHTGDVVTDISVLLTSPPAIPGSGFPQFRVHLNGPGTVELHLGNIGLGGLAQITVDDDLLSIEFVELNQDAASFPPETEDTLIIERTFDTEGDHVIDVIMLPAFDDAIPPIRFGGALRKVVLCGFEGMVTMADPVFRFTAECGLEISYNGTDYDPVPGWTENSPACFPLPIFSFTQDGFDLILNGNEVELARFDAEELVGKARTWLSWSAADCSLKFTWGDFEMKSAIPLAEWMWVDNWYSGGQPAIFDCLPDAPDVPVLGNRCNVTYWAANYITNLLDGYAERVLTGNDEEQSVLEIIESIFAFFEDEGVPGLGPWWFVNFIFIRNKLTTMDDIIELGQMRTMFTDGSYLALWQEAIYCTTPNDGALPDTWISDIATNALAYLHPAYGDAAIKMAELINNVLSLTDLRTHALLWELNDDHSLDCGEFDCEVEPSPPISVVVCGGYEGSIETITAALTDGTVGHYKAVLGWYDTSVPDTAQHICIAATGAGEEPDQCFIIENIVVTLGPEPDGYKGTGVGTGFTDCAFVDHVFNDIFDTENVEAVTVRWSHSAETAIEIEFDLRLVV